VSIVGLIIFVFAIALLILTVLYIAVRENVLRYPQIKSMVWLAVFVIFLDIVSVCVRQLRGRIFLLNFIDVMKQNCGVLIKV